MIRKLVLEDFMAHGHTELDLGPGLTVLTGPNNTGKSALVEGLRCLATNPPPKPYIRHGAKQARVEAHLDDGTIIAWVRKKASAIYELTRPGAQELEIYAKFGRTPPQDILDALRLDLVALETDPNNPVDVHIGNQREPIFLINRPSSAAAAFFATSTESAHLLAMQDRLKMQTRDAKREEKRLEAKLSGLEADLDQLAGLPGIVLAVEDLAARETAIQAEEQVLPRLEAMGNSLSGLVNALDQARNRRRALDALAPPEALYPAPQLARTLERGKSLDRERGRLGKRLVPLGRLQPPPRTEPTAALGDVITRIRGLEKAGDRLRKRQRPLTGLQQSPTIEETTPAGRILERMAGLEAERTALRNRLESLAKEQKELEQEISGRVEGRVCPLCGSRIEAGVFLGGAEQAGPGNDPSLRGGHVDAANPSQGAGADQAAPGNQTAPDQAVPDQAAPGGQEDRS